MASTTTEHIRMTETAHWLRLARAGATVMAVWSIALQGFAQALIPPVAVIGLVFLGFTPFLKGERRVLGLVAAVFGILALLGSVEIVLDDLRNPESAPTFILTTASLIGVGLAAFGGAAAYLRRPARSLVTFGFGATALFTVATVLSLVVAAGTGSDIVLDGDVEVSARQVAWTPQSIVLDPADTALWIDNRDGIRHTFTVPQIGVDVEVPALRARRIEIDAAPGTYEIICKVPGHEAMTGTLTIES